MLFLGPVQYTTHHHHFHHFQPIINKFNTSSLNLSRRCGSSLLGSVRPGQVHAPAHHPYTSCCTSSIAHPYIAHTSSCTSCSSSSLQLGQFLLQRCHLCGLYPRWTPRDHVGDVLAAMCKGQGIVGLVDVVIGRRRVHEHQRLRIAPNRVRHQHRQRVVAVRHVCLVRRQRRDDVAQCRERLVDRLRFFQLFARRSRLVHSFRSGQIH